MKAMLKSKRFKVTLLAVTLILSTFGGTYAWFTVQSNVTPSNISMGNLGVEAAFNADVEDALMEPGSFITKAGTVKNTGTLPMAAKLNLDTSITVFRDTAGNLLGAGYPHGMPAPAGDDYVSVQLDIMNMTAEDIVEIDGELYYYAWLYDLNNPSDIYLFADPSLELALNFDVNFSEDMGIRYMDATVSFAKSMTATQMVPRAILSELGIDVADLGYVSELQTNARAFSARNIKHEQIKAWVEEQLSN